MSIGSWKGYIAVYFFLNLFIGVQRLLYNFSILVHELH